MNRPLRVLLTSYTLSRRSGSECHMRDLALSLLERGHTPIVYSTQLGEIAAELRAATVPVIDNLDALGAPPTIIHGNHHPEIMTALLRFPGVPAIHFCHAWISFEAFPPRFPRILRYIAVDDTCRDRLLFQEGIPEAQVRVLLNAVDLKCFHSRGPLTDHPRRALVFSNYAGDFPYLDAVRAACASTGLQLDVIGSGVGKTEAHPEQIIGTYDLVFAKARCALEALAVGTAVILCDASGVGFMVTTENLEKFRRLNFGLRTLQHPVTPEVLEREIARYDPKDAKEVARRIRDSAGLDATVDQLLELYDEVLEEYARAEPADPFAELRAAADYLRWLAGELRSAKDDLSHVGAELKRRDAAIAALAGSATLKLRNRLVNLPVLGKLARSAARLLVKGSE